MKVNRLENVFCNPPLPDDDYVLLSEAQAEIEEYKRKYKELIYAVASKFPDESRHETALRYIKQAEIHDNMPEQADKGE